MRHQTLPVFDVLPQDLSLTGICYFGFDNLDQLALALGDEEAERFLDARHALLQSVFGAGNVAVRRVVRGFIATLRQSDQAESLALIERSLALLNDDSHFAGSPVTVFAGIAWRETDRNDGEGQDSAALAIAAIAAANAASAGLKSLCIRGQQSEAALQSARLLCDLRAAMADDRLTILGQEIRSPAPDGSEARHYEILIQMTACDGSVQPPSRFLPLAENSALIEYLDRWVFRKVLLGYGEALRQRPWISLSLNLSGRTLGQAETWAFLEETISASGIAPSRLHLEITETTKIADMPQAIATVRAARSFGLGVALDDFGAGLSGYGYLRAFDVNSIKIDGALVPNVVDESSIEAEIVRSIMSLSRRLNIEVVAEHVSSAEILAALAGMGVSRVQGYEVGMPQPLEDIFRER